MIIFCRPEMVFKQFNQCQLKYINYKAYVPQNANSHDNPELKLKRKKKEEKNVSFCDSINIIGNY